MTKLEQKMKAVIISEVKRMLREEDEDVDPQMEDELESALMDASKKLNADMAKVGKEVETKLQDDSEVAKVLEDEPTIKKLAQESANRRGTELSEDTLNEEFFSMTFIVGMTLAIPSIVTLIGSIVKVVETKLGGKTQMGDKLKHIGHEMHEGIIKFIMNGMKLIPGFSKLSPERQKKIASLVHIIIVAYLAIHSGGVALHQVKDGLQAANVSTTLIEGALTAVKSGEVASWLKQTILAIVSK